MITPTNISNKIFFLSLVFCLLHIAGFVWRGKKPATRGRGRTVIFTPKTQRSCKRYHPHALQLAVENVRAGRMTQRKASEIYGIPQQTISDHVKKRTYHDLGESVSADHSHIVEANYFGLQKQYG